MNSALVATLKNIELSFCSTCLQIKNCCKCKSTRTYSCNSVPDPLHMFLTMPQCHMRANKCSMRAL